MSEPRKTTMSPSPEAKLDPNPGTESDQAPALPGPSLGPEASVSQSDEVPESADVPNDQDQHSEEEKSRLCKAHRDAEEHHPELTEDLPTFHDTPAGQDRDQVPREFFDMMQEVHLQEIRWNEVRLKGLELLRRKEELEKDEAEMEAMRARLVERRVVFAKEHEEFQKKKQALDIEYDGICDRLEALGPVDNVGWKEALQKYRRHARG